MCQGLSHFKGILHHFILAKLATSSIGVESFSKVPESVMLLAMFGSVILRVIKWK